MGLYFVLLSLISSDDLLGICPATKYVAACIEARTEDREQTGWMDGWPNGKGTTFLSGDIKYIMISSRSFSRYSVLYSVMLFNVDDDHDDDDRFRRDLSEDDDLSRPYEITRAKRCRNLLSFFFFVSSTTTIHIHNPPVLLLLCM